MRVKLLYTLLVMLFAFSSALAQLVFSNAPEHRAFLPQDKNLGAANYRLQGKVTDNSYTLFQVDVLQDGKLYKSYRPALRLLGINRYFDLSIPLPTGKHFYSFKYTLYGSTTYTNQVDSILVGDVYLVQGQSNAVAGDYGGNAATKFDDDYYSPFLRSFGSSSATSYWAKNDTMWHDIEASRAYSKGSVGQWAAVMARSLLDSFDIPICLLNGAHGGRRIDFFIPDASDHYNTNTNYGRLLSRVRNANLQSNIRGIFFFQGESDGSLAVKHDTTFRQIVKSWKKDYPGFEKLYVIQVREGCGAPSLQLREVQRQFGLTIDRCKTVSANGLNAHDGCHYNFINGYELLGLQLAQLIGKDLYNSGQKNVDPPNVKSVVYNNAKHTEIKLQMQRPLDSIDADSGFQQLFTVMGDPTVSIIAGSVRNNEVILSLNKSSCSTLTLNYNGAAGQRPWVKNKTKMGLLSFYNVPIANHLIDEDIFACKDQLKLLGKDSIPGYLYHWKDLETGKTFSGAQWEVSIDSSQYFQLIIRYDTSLCVDADTVELYVEVDPIVLPNFDSLYTLCKEDTLQINPDPSAYSYFEWQKQKAWTYQLDTTEAVIWNGMSMKSCFYTDSFSSNLIVLKIPLTDSLKICQGTDTLLQLHDSFDIYWWNGEVGPDSFRSGSGSVQLQASSQGCIDSATIWIGSYPKPQFPKETYHSCVGDTVEIHKANGIIRWFVDQTPLADTLFLWGDTTVLIQWIDSQNCIYQNQLTSISLPLPTPNLQNDTGFCENEKLYVNLGTGAYHYEWADTLANISERLISKAGNYSVRVTDSNFCSINESFQVERWLTPSLYAFRDSALCQDSLWLIPLQDSTSYWINGELKTAVVRLYPDSVYHIEASSIFGCTSVKNISVDVIDCMLNIEKLSQSCFQVYPNPSHDQLNIKSTGSANITSIQFLDPLGRLLQSKTLPKTRSYIVDLHSMSGTVILVIGLENGLTIRKRIIIE